MSAFKFTNQSASIAAAIRITGKMTDIEQ